DLSQNGRISRFRGKWPDDPPLHRARRHASRARFELTEPIAAGTPAPTGPPVFSTPAHHFWTHRARDTSLRWHRPAPVVYACGIPTFATPVPAPGRRAEILPVKSDQ